jgi:hypothetical protein
MVLINVRNGQIVREFRGEAFRISPDDLNVCYISPFGRAMDEHAVFVNDTMLYPVVRSGFREGIYGPETADRTKLTIFIRNEGGKKLFRVLTAPVWGPKGELTFNVDETRFDPSQKPELQPDFFFEVTATVQVKDGVTTGSVRKTRREP